MKSLNLLCSALVLALSGCTAAPRSTAPRESVEYTRIGTVTGSTVDRVIDREYGVVCYVSDGYNAGGISCMRHELVPLR